MMMNSPVSIAMHNHIHFCCTSHTKRVHPNKLRLMTGTESHQGIKLLALEMYPSVEWNRASNP